MSAAEKTNLSEELKHVAPRRVQEPAWKNFGIEDIERLKKRTANVVDQWNRDTATLNYDGQIIGLLEELPLMLENHERRIAALEQEKDQS